MKRYSLRRRLIATVLLLECALIGGMDAATLFYTWRERVHALDLVARGRADSLLGAVRDAEDAADNVIVSPEALDLHAGDLWTVRDWKGRTLASSPGWSPALVSDFTDGKPHNFHTARGKFHGLVLHGIRQIDAEGNNPGVSRPVTIDYAVSLHPAYDAVGDASRFLLLSSTLLLLLTGGAVAWLLRRGLAPLEELSAAAAQVTPRRPRFHAPESAAAVSELAVLAGALESATQRLQEAFEQQHVFVHDAAHELKTAVTIVKSSLQLLASRPRSTREYASGLQTCMADCARMEELVQRMLQLARFEQEPAGRHVSCDLADVTRDVATQMETLAEIRQVSMAVHAPAAAPVPLAEEAAGSLLANLLLNAVQHTPAGGSVTTEVSVGTQAVVEIRDNGSGIAPEDLPHLFERFWRGDRSRARSTGGTGLGLSICKAIVDSCGGEIVISSRLGEGTCVTVRLPLLSPPEQQRSLRAANEPVNH